ncbi:MAG: ATP-binding protein [Patescibacteria group bacterium]
MQLYCRLFRECAKNNLRFWECPQALFVLMGILTIGIMLGTYFIVDIYASPEMVVASVSFIAAIMLIIGDLISRAVDKINQAKIQAEEERRKTQAIVANLTDGLVLLSPKWEIIFINPRACDFLDIKEGFSASLKYIKDGNLLTKYPNLKEIIGKPLSSRDFAKKKIISEIISFGKPEKYFRVFTTPIDNNTGSAGYIKIIHDVTRERELDKMKSEFISLASHQLRGPLSGNKWLIELLLNKKTGKLNERQKKFLNEITKGNERMIRLVSELLDVARIEEYRMEVKLEKTDAVKLIFEIMRIARILALQKNINLEFAPKEDKIFIRIDTDKMKMVFQNLIENAIKYTKNGGSVKIKAEVTPFVELEKSLFSAANGYFKIKSLEHNADYLIVSVSDSGIGISKEDENRIFSKFYRGKRAKEIEAQGTGLGLYVGKQIVEKHQGALWFKSEEGKGATFYVAIPKEN